MRKILRWRADEFVVALITAATVVIVGVKQGILLAMVLSVIDHLRRGYHPRDMIVVRTSTGGFRSVPGRAGEFPNEDIEPGLIIYRFAASLYYANANRVRRGGATRSWAPRGPRRWFCLDAACDR